MFVRFYDVFIMFLGWVWDDLNMNWVCAYEDFRMLLLCDSDVLTCLMMFSDILGCLKALCKKTEKLPKNLLMTEKEGTSLCLEAKNRIISTYGILKM